MGRARPAGGADRRDHWGGAIPTRPHYKVVVVPERQRSAASTRTSPSRAWPAISPSARPRWSIHRVEGGGSVENGHGAPPTVWFWTARGLGRTSELSREDLRAGAAPIDERDDSEASDLLAKSSASNWGGAEQAGAYLARQGRSRASTQPRGRIVAERFFDEAGGMQLILHRRSARASTGPGACAAQAVLPLLRLRAAGRCDDMASPLADRQHAFPLESLFDFVSR